MTDLQVPETWTKEFFGTVFIEIFERLGKFNTTNQDLPALITIMQQAPGAKILDVPCGFGRIAGPLHQAGYIVTGVDASQDLLAYARLHHPGPSYHHGDMRDAFTPGYDVVLNLWTSFGYFEERADDLRALQAWYDCLKTGGKLIMELSDLERAQTQNRAQDLATRTTSSRSSYHKREINGVIDEVWIDWNAQLARTRFTYGDKQIVGKNYIYSQAELQTMLDITGFVNIEFYGGFDKHPKQANDRLVIVGTK